MNRMGRPAIATPDRILRAAFARFSGYGFRRTSMEDIAAEAGVSRAALYLQFRNKEEIFRRLAQDLHDEALANAEAALRADLPVADRLRAGVEAKSLRFVQITYGSPHGSELLDENNRLCGDLAADMERRFQAMVTRTLRHAAQRGELDLRAHALTAPEAAELFTHAVSGLKGPGVTVDAYRRRVATLARVFVAGLAARAARRTATVRGSRRAQSGVR